MLELMDARTRGLLVLAQAIGVEESAEALGPEHLLAALVWDGGTSQDRATSTRVLATFGVSWPVASLLGQTLRGRRPVRPLTREEAEALRDHGVDLDSVQGLPRSVEAVPDAPRPRRWGRKRAAEPEPERPAGHLRFSEEARKALECMLREALRLEDRYLGSEHLLLGLLGSGSPAPVSVLRVFGVDLDRARAAVVAMPRGPDEGLRTP